MTAGSQALGFAREKRLLLGGAALLAPLPLPFNDVLAWPVSVLYTVLVALYLRRVRHEPERWLPVWAMNVLAGLYLPVFFFDLLVLSGGRIVQPVIHLLLFAVVVKLFSLARERDKWQALLAIFFLFLAAMGTSTHPAMILYLLAFLSLGLYLLARFAYLHVLAGFGQLDAQQARLPLNGVLLVSTLLIVLVSVPLFTVLPRINSPFFVGGGRATQRASQTTGYSDEVTLDSIGLTRQSREVVMRVRYEDEPPLGHDRRFKVAAHHRFRNNVWLRAETRGNHMPRRSEGFMLAARPPVSWAKVWMRPLSGQRLGVPPDASRVAVEQPVLVRTFWGAVTLDRPTASVVEYRLGLTGRPQSLGLPPIGEETRIRAAALNTSGVTPQIADLARQVAGPGTPRQQAEALQSWFHEEFDYTLDFLGRGGEQPLDDFLFRFKSGHCEYFASAMVLMLRSQEIPARLATGFLGGEYNPLEGYFIVRGLNAHAWVEAYLPGEGWRTFDPTPPAGRPEQTRSGLLSIFTQGYDYMMFRWDRYVITYSFADQARLLVGFKELWDRLWSWRDDDQPAQRPTVEEPAPTAQDAVAEEESPLLSDTARRWITAALAALALLTLYLILRAGRPLTATRVYRRLRQRLARAGLPAGDGTSLAPLALQRTVAERFPAAAGATGAIVRLYLEESFGGSEIDDDDRQRLVRSFKEASKQLRQRKGRRAS